MCVDSESCMKIIIAPDKFKGSLTSFEFCELVAETILKRIPHAEIVKLPMADGGDGTVGVLNYYINAKVIYCKVNDPLFRKVEAKYLYSEHKSIAYIEMAEASGLHLLSEEEKNPLYTSTYGTGELIRDAINRGAKHIILGIGGSATNDAGIGLASALGFRFFNSSGKILKGIGGDLLKVNSFDSKYVSQDISKVKFDIACDVQNPLYGPNGAAFVYASQKGANFQQIKNLDLGLLNVSSILPRGQEFAFKKGAGAAGGLGFGAMVFLNANLYSGVDLLKNISNLSAHLKGADWLITGEGKLDGQTLAGKLVKGVIEECETQKVAVFCGVNQLSNEKIKQLKVAYCDELIAYSSSQEDAIMNARKYLPILTQKYLSSLLGTK